MLAEDAVYCMAIPKNISGTALEKFALCGAVTTVTYPRTRAVHNLAPDTVDYPPTVERYLNTSFRVGSSPKAYNGFNTEERYHQPQHIG